MLSSELSGLGDVDFSNNAIHDLLFVCAHVIYLVMIEFFALLF